MALLAVIRRLQLTRLSTPASPQFALSLFAQVISPTTNPAPVSFFRQFHRPPCARSQLTPDFSFLECPFGRSSDRIPDFFEDVAHEDNNPSHYELLERIHKAKDFASGDEALAFLDDSGIKLNKEIIFYLIFALREEWKLAFLVYKWGGKWDCVVEKSWCLMIWILGNNKKFSTAWSLIHELCNSSKDIQRAMLIMIDRYAAANEIDKAIRTFHLMQKFKFSPDLNTYFAFMNILCNHGNVEEAEDFMYLNKKFFPLEVESFNIILNGWCNITIDIYEAKRVWREMSKCCIEPNGTSYKHMISCYSSVANLFESLRLYDEMKKKGWIPGMEVYHSLVRVLSHENCLSEALKIVDLMKELGFEPNSTTYDLIISPLCKSSKFEDAKNVLARMIIDGVDPSPDTYNALLVGESLEGTLGMMKHMREIGLNPSSETFSLLLNKFFEMDEAENALTIWSEMSKYEVKANDEHYHILVQGLVGRGLIAKAREFYSKMKSIDPSLTKLIQNSTRKEKEQMTVVRHVKIGRGLRRWKSNIFKGERREKQ